MLCPTTCMLPHPSPERDIFLLLYTRLIGESPAMFFTYERQTDKRTQLSEDFPEFMSENGFREMAFNDRV